MSSKLSQGYFFDRNKQYHNSSVAVLSIVNTKVTWNNVKTFSHPFWVLDYSVGGCGFCRVKTASWLERASGTVHLYAPGTRYWEKRSSGSLPGFSSFITFYGGEYLDLQKYVNNRNGFGRFLDKTGKLEKLLANTAAEAAFRGEESYWFVMTKLYEIADILHGAQPLEDEAGQRIINPANDGNRSHEQIFVEAVRAYLQKHIGENVSIADLSSHLNASISTISHKYRTLTGETPMKTLTTFRVHMVKALLMKGEPIKSIAAQTGFYDEFHLSKVFKQATGIAPSRYLKTF
jgi:AraC-like DNA-binding protein